ncbi:hypothetical protein [Antrihabitans sp. YC2-6]|uniref:hypothetical protein n=1 Tax=Antrihabitans sp. YC2-6 TaxID=2799498 RepID=UPI0018F7B70C|nr:hypothetical protein [Antrihabitans sp. YC2-6]MBJ8348849.1 hypothetical protein [Antrihabitans sp. YC2-6]
MFDVIEAFALTTDRSFALELVDYVSKLPPSIVPDPQTAYGVSAHWIPSTTVPARVVDCYLGTLSNLDRGDYRSGVEALPAPPGMSADDFRDYVGFVLRQRLLGRIYRECEGQQQWPAIEHMRQLLAAARVYTVEDPPMIWSGIKNWFTYLPSRVWQPVWRTDRGSLIQRHIANGTSSLRALAAPGTASSSMRGSGRP